MHGTLTGMTRLRRSALIAGLLAMLLGMGLLATPGGTLAAPAGAPLKQGPCDNPPDQSATVTPKCGPKGTVFQVTVMGFTPNEPLSFWFTDPNGNVIGTANPFSGNHGADLTLPVDTNQQ